SRPKPVSAAALARIEKQRRDIVKRLGPCPSGCSDLDGYVLLGGLERGSVVGISAEEEDVVGLGLQISICSLLSKAVHKVQIVTPKPPSTILVLLKNAIAAELKAQGVTAAEDVAAQRRDCLDRIMLSRVFDMDGFCEVLADLEDGLPERGIQQEHTVDQAEAQTTTDIPGTIIINNNNTTATDVPNHRATTTTTNPDIIIVTHFSSLLTSFFTQRDKPTAHATIRHLSARLRRLSRTLPSHPLVLIINSTDSEQSPAHHNRNNNNHKSPPAVAPTLRSIFNPATASGQQGFFKLNKPTFGLVFTQLLDLHLLCTRAPRPPRKETTASSRALTVVEVLLDDTGLWQGERGRRRRREQRWTVVESSSGRIV
ncbi:hypothetical protein M419DRAFT_44436, partial [Trichoderma reesei RUT C-30]